MSTTAVYYRVSADSQDIAAQRHAVEQWLATRGITTYTTYTDVASGRKDSRPEFQRLCADVRNRRIMCVITFRLDRISRKATTALGTLLEWMQLGAEFYAVDQPILSLGRDNPLRLTIIAMFSELAQLEREAIVARVRSGMAAARARGVRLGALPKLTEAQLAAARAARAAGARVDHLAEQYGVSTATMSRSLRRGGGNDVR